MRKYVYFVAVIVVTILITSLMKKEHMKPLNVGDKIPSFKLKDQDGNWFDSDAIIGLKPAVIYFYPKDDTPGCTKEACKFRDEFEVFTDLNAKVVGISSDDVASHKKFALKYKLPFTLLADTNQDVRNLFGVPKSVLGLIPGRVTYVVNQKGIIIYIFESQFGAQKHIEEAIRALKNS